MTIDWDDIQGNILRAYLFPRARLLTAEIIEPEAGLRWLRDRVLPLVEAPPPGKRQPPLRAVNVGFSHAGLAALGTDPAVLAAFPLEFREGMWARAGLLGDTDWERGWCNQPARDPSDRERVPVGGPDRPVAVHVVIDVHAEDPAQLDEVTTAVGLDDDGAAGVRLTGITDLATLEAGDGPDRPAGDGSDRPAGDGSDRPAGKGPGGGARRARREHFGFADGLSQPRIAGVDRASKAQPPDRVPWWARWWIRPRPEPNPLIALGEFVLGYADEDNPAPALPEPAALFRNGSYLVLRKLGQDVAAFRAFVDRAAELAREAGGEVAAADIATAVMGRRPDGQALTEPMPGGDRDRDFSFRDDPDGTGCPLGAHIRRSNPRDGHVLGAAVVNRHRLLRRGLPYGPAVPDGVEPDEAERGIMFAVYGASISRQFEFVQRSWLNDGDAVGIGHNGDVIGGSPGVEATVAVPGLGRVRRGEPFVIPQGGEYLFVPGLCALARLAAGRLRAATAAPAAIGPPPTPGTPGP